MHDFLSNLFYSKDHQFYVFGTVFAYWIFAFSLNSNLHNNINCLKERILWKKHTTNHIENPNARIPNKQSRN